MPQWPDTRASGGEDDVRRKRDQFRRVFASVIFIAFGPAVVDLNVLTDGPTRLLKTLQEGCVAVLCLRIIRSIGHERRHAPHVLALLCARRERPRRRRAAE